MLFLKKSHFVSIIAVAVLLAACAPAHKPESTAPVAAPLSPAEKVIDTYLAAIGGRMAAEKVHNIHLHGKLSVMGNALDFDDYHRAPNLRRTEAKVAGQPVFVRVFNGEKGYTMQMGAKANFSDDELAQSKDGYVMPELHYDSLGITAKLEGTEDLDGEQVNKLALTHADGKVSYHYFSVESGLKLKVVSTVEGTVEQVFSLSDYREVEGVKLPFKLKIATGPNIMNVDVANYTLNQPGEDSLFTVE